MQFLRLLVRKSRELYVGEIAVQYIKISREAKGIVDVDVSSVMPLDPKVLKVISAQVAEYTGKNPEIAEKTNPDLIGGFQVSFGDAMLDVTIRKKLNIIAQKFQDNIYKKGF
ncbi:MAG: ATP synthase F1 subunit delta [Marinilabiliales bacterium]|nr:MAG: ATP synthase F1 subunit delta [Marinilabiliales bacterium]